MEKWKTNNLKSSLKTIYNLLEIQHYCKWLKIKYNKQELEFNSKTNNKEDICLKTHCKQIYLDQSHRLIKEDYFHHQIYQFIVHCRIP